MVGVLRAVPVSEMVTNGQTATMLAYEHFLDAVSSARAKYREAKRGDKLALGACG
jgi:hypothetical protein